MLVVRVGLEEVVVLVEGLAVAGPGHVEVAVAQLLAPEGDRLLLGVVLAQRQQLPELLVGGDLPALVQPEVRLEVLVEALEGHLLAVLVAHHPPAHHPVT